MGERYKETYKYLNYVENLLILSSAHEVYVSIFSLTSLFCVLNGVASSTVGLKNSAFSAGIKTFKSFIKKKKEKHYEIVFLGKAKLNSIEILISKSFIIDSYIIPGKFVSVNNVLRGYNAMREEAKTSVEHYINAVDISRKTQERNRIEILVDNDGILQLTEIYAEE